MKVQTYMELSDLENRHVTNETEQKYTPLSFECIFKTLIKDNDQNTVQSFPSIL